MWTRVAALAIKINPKATWEDLILPDDALAQLREVCDRVIHHERVFNDWGFARKLSRGCGTPALFSGGSGTGKTMAAEVIARESLGAGPVSHRPGDRVVSKYIGETEKNLRSVFDGAERSKAILFFDEADALFGKRTEVKMHTTGTRNEITSAAGDGRVRRPVDPWRRIW